MPPGKHTTPDNSRYSLATGIYGVNAQKHATDPREVEARVLLKSAQLMIDLQKDWDSMTQDTLDKTLKYNRDIWMMFYDTAIEDVKDERPKELKNNICGLANFIFKREIDIKAKPDKKKLDILISINRDIATGLMDGVRNASALTKNGENSDHDTKMDETA